MYFFVSSSRVIAHIQRDQERQPNVVVKTGLRSDLLLRMDDWTFTRHLHLNTDQYERFVHFLNDTVVNDPSVALGGMPRIPVEKRALMFL